MKKKRVLVTGALGHIGSRLMLEMRKNSDAYEKVCFLDIASAQRYPKSSGIYEYVQCDIRSKEIEKFVSASDVVIHLAALTDAERSKEFPRETFEINFEGAKRVIDACQKHETRILFPSTTSVYGSQESMIDETCAELLPQSPYAESKLAVERYLLSKNDEMRFMICRFGTIVGPSLGMRFHTAVNKFIWQAIAQEPITVWRTAYNQKRPYLELGDCVRAIRFITDTDCFANEIVNVVTENLTVQNVTHEINTHMPIKIQLTDSAIMNQLSYEVDASKFASMGFPNCHRKGGIAKGIAETIQWLG
ncbi:MAG: SDR family oxidoreductase [Patescibacteria group bacterium]|mgnify:FL=1